MLIFARWHALNDNAVDVYQWSLHSANQSALTYSGTKDTLSFLYTPRAVLHSSAKVTSGSQCWYFWAQFLHLHHDLHQQRCLPPPQLHKWTCILTGVESIRADSIHRSAWRIAANLGGVVSPPLQSFAPFSVKEEVSGASVVAVVQGKI